MQIREAITSDINGIIDVCTEAITVSCIEDHKGQAEIISGWLANKTPENMQKLLSDPEHFLAVAEMESKVLGVALISRQGYLSLTYVHPISQNQGVGKQLLDAVEEYASHVGCDLITLDSTKAAKTFYARNGYMPQSDIKKFLGMQVFPMCKNIAANKLNQPGTLQSNAPV